MEPDEAKVFPRWLYYWLLWDTEGIKKAHGVGATMLHVTKGSMEQRSISVPPLTEQRRIVAILDEAFKDISKATENAERNLANARELPEALLERALESQNGWREAGLSEIAEFKNGLNFTRTSNGEEIKIVGVKDFQNDYWVPSAGLESVSIDGNLAPNYELRPNDILTVRSNGNKQLIGRCIIARDVPEKTSHSGFTIRIRVQADDVRPEFLTYVLKRRVTRATLVASGDGANITSLNQQALAALQVSFPDLKLQDEILAKIRFELGEANKLLDIRRNSLSKLNDLRKSVLRKAFSGQLTKTKASAA
jgi:type I restriction enzyme S subunit